MVGNKERRYQLILTIVMTLISLVMVIPLILLLMASVTSNNEIVMHGYSFWPKEFSLEAYRYIWNEKGQIFRAYGDCHRYSHRSDDDAALWLCPGTPGISGQDVSCILPVLYHAVQWRAGTHLYHVHPLSAYEKYGGSIDYTGTFNECL